MAPSSSQNAVEAQYQSYGRGYSKGCSRGPVLRLFDTDDCRLCYNREHWARNCPNRLVVNANVDMRLPVLLMLIYVMLVVIKPAGLIWRLMLMGIRLLFCWTLVVREKKTYSTQKGQQSDTF